VDGLTFIAKLRYLFCSAKDTVYVSIEENTCWYCMRTAHSQAVEIYWQARHYYSM